MDLVGSWRVVEIDGEAVLDDVVPTIDFAGDGRVYGLASVNRFHGSCTVVDGELVFTPLASTMMMGPPEPMDQEGRFLTALHGAMRVSARDDGRVELFNDTRRVLLRRARVRESEPD